MLLHEDKIKIRITRQGLRVYRDLLDARKDRVGDLLDQR
jgi:hypothetical protein